MAGAIEVVVKGQAEVRRALQGLKQSLRSRILRKAVTAASRLVMIAAKARVPKRTGLLKKSIGRKIRTYRNSGAVVAIVGPRKGFKKEIGGVLVNPTQYAGLVEYGTSRSAARPFIRPAWDATRDVAERTIAQVVRDEVAKLDLKRGK